MEYPVECKDCGFIGEDEVFLHCIIDQISGDTDVFCPACESNYLVFHTPKEDAKREWD